jgi:hypothetical protein
LAFCIITLADGGARDIRKWLSELILENLYGEDTGERFCIKGSLLKNAMADTFFNILVASLTPEELHPTTNQFWPKI